MKLNKSKTYLLAYFSKYIPIKFIKQINNTYLFFNNDYNFCLRYEYSGKKEFTEYEKELESNEYYKLTIDINKKEVLYVFNIPDDLYSTVDLFISGKYSSLPDKEFLINFLIKNFDLKIEDKIIKIINRDLELKIKIEEELNIKIPEGVDLSSVPDLDDENFIYAKDE